MSGGQPEPLRNPRNENEEEEDRPSPSQPEPAPAPPNNIDQSNHETTPEEEALILPSLPNEISRHICSFLGVQDILCKQTVSKPFQKGLKQALEDKAKPNAGKFKTAKKLKAATNKFCNCKYVKFDPEVAEEIARDYGWNMNLWDVSEIRSFRRLFRNKRKFNEDISMWNVANGRDFRKMFSNAVSFKGDLSSWNLESATTLNRMFEEASSFCSDLSRWNVASVVDMCGMFEYASSFTSDLSKWETGSVRCMGGMFSGASSFQSDLSGWNTGKLENARGMFRGASSFQSDLSGWNTENLRSVGCMFFNATLFKADLSEWSLARVPQYYPNSDDPNPVFTFGMFYRCSIMPEDVKDWTGWNFTLANEFRCVFEGHGRTSEFDRFKRQLEEEEAASKKQDDSKGKK